jgi:hypothetical protein
MPSILPGYEYDIFISYRQNDNKRDSWVTKFVEALRDELDATLKEQVTIYFDENPHDGLHEHHEVDDSLREKLKCLILIPVVSQTFCDPKSFAWEHEFKVFVEQAGSDQFGLKVKLPGGNVANRVLPIRIHDLDSKDVSLFEAEIGSVMRPIDFIYQETGVNRPLLANEVNPSGNQNDTFYRNQVNKVANAIKEILNSLSTQDEPDLYADSKSDSVDAIEESVYTRPVKLNKSGSSKGNKSTFSISAKAKRFTFFTLILFLFGILFIFVGRATKHIPMANNPVLRYEVPIDDVLARTGRHALAVSPDGQLLVFIQEEQFYLKQLNDDGPAKPISGTNTEHDKHPFFSPDGKWIGFDGEGGIYKIPVTGGTPTKIWNGGRIFGMNWVGNQIIFTTQGVIYSISENGGVAERLYPINEEDIDSVFWNPQLLPDNKTLLFNQLVNRVGGSDSFFYNIRTWELESKEAPKTIIARGNDVQYLNSGHISYVIDKRLYIAGFDYNTGLLTDSPQLIASEEIDVANQAAQYDFSDNGVLVYYPQIEAAKYNIAWIDKKGTATNISDNSAEYFSPKISSDGKDVVVDKRVPNVRGRINTEIINIRMGTNYLFAETANSPVWAQGNQSIIYIDDFKVYQKPLYLGEPTRILFEMDSWVYGGDMTKDERYYTFAADTKAEGFTPDLGYYDFARDTVVMMDNYNTDHWEFDPLISPDGKWLLYSSDFSGEDELYVGPFPGPGPRYKISADGAAYGIWAPDMSAVYYIEAGSESDMWEVKLTLEPEFSFEKPKSLFRGHYYNSIRGSLAGRFDIHPDGDRFLMLNNAEIEVPPGIKVIVNWQQELLK